MRVYNFGAGPSALPYEVLKSIEKELLDFNNTGMSIMELSHRSKEFDLLYDELILGLRTLLNIPDNYEVFFMQGGATTEFSCVALNLMKNKKADYIVSGLFSKKAQIEALKYGDARVIASSEDKNFTYIPYVTKFNIDSDYVHICFNNTVYGTTYNYIPDTGKIPLVCDMSSFILSRNIDISKFGLIYAGCQKNMGIAGNTLVIIRKDLIGNAMKITPVMLDYKVQSENKSMYNTPPVFSIYVTYKVVKYLLSIGGLDKVEEINKEKAKLLYDYLDSSKLFKGVCEKEFRSISNVCFKTTSSDLDSKFVSFCKDKGIVGIKGHRLVGGLRASIYNGVTLDAVHALIKAMKEFEENEI